MAIASLVEDEANRSITRLVYFGWLSEIPLNLFLGGVLNTLIKALRLAPGRFA